MHTYGIAMDATGRPTFNRQSFDERYGWFAPAPTQQLRNYIQVHCSPGNLARWMIGRVPFIGTMRTYKWRQDILSDIIAGISSAVVHVPFGMAMAAIAGVAPVYGLYASFWQVLIYMIFGSCYNLAIGPMALPSLIVRAVVEKEVAIWKRGVLGTNITDPTALNASVLTVNSTTYAQEEVLFRISVATAVSCIAGLTMLVMGILQMGVVKIFMPTSFISGFTTAATFHVITSQAAPLLNLSVHRHTGWFNFPRNWYNIFRALPKTNIPTLVISIICLAFLICTKEVINEKYKEKMKIPIPADIIAVIISTLISYLVHFKERWGVQTVGFVSTGFQSPKVPNFEHGVSFITDGIAAGIVSMAISLAMVDILARKRKYQPDSNQELFAYGMTYGLSAFLQCVVGSTAPPICFIMERAGGKTVLAHFFTCIILLLVILAIGSVFQFLPTAILACIIIVALFSLVKQVRVLPTLWRLSKPDFVIWITTFLVSLVLDVSMSLGIGIGVVILTSVTSAMYAKGYRYGETQYSDLRAPIQTHRKVNSRPDIAVFRYECTLYFITAANFKRELFKATVDPKHLPTLPFGEEDDFKEPNDDKFNPEQIHAGFRLKTIILDCAPIGYTDIMAINVIRSLHSDYKAVGISFVLADCNPLFLQKLRVAKIIDTNIGLGDLIPVFPTVQDAIKQSRINRPLVLSVSRC